jgi:hypothetical protein
MQTVRAKFKCTTASGNERSWLKLVTAVDITKKDGFAFSGEFLPLGKETDVPVGAIVVEKEPINSVKNRAYIANVYQVVLEPIDDVRNPNLEFLTEFKWRGDFLSFRDYVAELLQPKPVEPLIVALPANVVTVADLMSALSKLPPGAVILNSADHINGAWSKFDLEPVRAVLNSRYGSANENPHRILHNSLDEEWHTDSYPDEPIIDAYHI